ncbi:Nucleotidyltransferase [Gloeophyllum trabeum ATCC 11539]|uniref:DNA polymerase n=1 Tax=Gloeophyllum trabeum (strain ATCC 11539 / FP-39264 / Madison 617) TaxID=670483 RepID=S7Q6H8_GLOTA|nr:Nucleotidyltransferase [Gloeophyllum trabeum ATCC 11539]EPQ55117.1 Nucleotidyltransferase [Gloeophyllum trabeum ATCC 11539]
MKKRLQRHLDWEAAKEKAIVKPDWIRDSVSRGEAQPCGDYAALEDLHDETVKNCSDKDRESSAEPEDDEAGPSRQSEPSQTQLPSPPSSPSSDADGTTKRLSKVSLKDTSSSPHPKKPVSSVSTQPTASRASTVNVPAYLLPPDFPIPTNLAKLSYMSRYACCRASPLVCPNQGLCNELNIIRKSREVEGEDRSALSYERAISVIKAYLNRITSLAQVKVLPYIGEKISGLVEEYLNTNQISEARSILDSERYRSLTAFTSIYGIGPNTVRKLYARGLRTIRDLEVWYGVRPPEGEEDDEGVYEQQRERRIISVEGQSGRRGRGRNEGAEVEDDSWIKIALGLREELDIKIPRDEVEEIGRVVGRELEQVQPGCVFTIVGGYRRGKPMSNDVDIVFTHPEVEKVKGLCGRFVNQLYERGFSLVSHVMHLSGFHAHNALRTTHWDSLEKALTVFTLPEDSPFARDFPEGKGGEVKRRGVRRRLDLIFAMPEVYWTAVIGWTGSIMFQRDLRQWATDKRGYKFDSSGITRRRDSKQLFPKTEKDVFDLFELEWVDPTWRNADV